MKDDTLRQNWEEWRKREEPHLQVSEGDPMDDHYDRWLSSLSGDELFDLCVAEGLVRMTPNGKCQFK